MFLPIDSDVPQISSYFGTLQSHPHGSKSEHRDRDVSLWTEDSAPQTRQSTQFLSEEWVIFWVSQNALGWGEHACAGQRRHRRLCSVALGSLSPRGRSTKPLLKPDPKRHEHILGISWYIIQYIPCPIKVDVDG